MRRIAVGVAMIALAALALSWAAADDQEIVKELTNRLKHERDAGTLRDFNIDLKVADGNVLLKGQVASAQQQQRALEIARETKGVKRVINDLRVDERAAASPGQVAEKTADAPAGDDDTIAKAAVQALGERKKAGDLKGFRVNIAVTRGELVLNGTVQNAAQRQIVLDTVRTVSGVKNVVDRLSLKEGPAATDAKPASPQPVSGDQQIGERITAEFKRLQEAGDLKGFGIRLSVDEGVVVLSGRVASGEQARAADEIARKTPGVREVVNRLVVVGGAAETKAPSLADKAAPAASPAIVRPEAAGPSDDQIAQSIIAELRREKEAGNLKSFSINTSVKSGVVTLAGRVPDAKQRDLAEELARAAQGVRDVFNEIAVVTPTPVQTAEPTPALETPAKAAGPTDEELAQAIISGLKREKDAGNLKRFTINTTVKDGVATLAGRVADEKQRDLAAELAQKTAGVREVVNQIAVAEPAETKPAAPAVASPAPSKADDVNDEQIAQEMASELRRQKIAGKLKGFDIELAVAGGVVTMDGFVGDPRHRELAETIARGVEGVKSVSNQIQVRAAQPEPLVAAASPVETTTFVLPPQPTLQPAAPLPAEPAPHPVAQPVAYRPESVPSETVRWATEDRRIGQQLSEKLRMAKDTGRLQGFGIGVNVARGDVTLRGKVASAQQKQMAIALAHDVPGVNRVIDELAVDHAVPVPAAPSATAIAQEVGQRLQQLQSRGQLAGADLGLQVDQGTVWLKGTVANEQQHQLAVAAARQVRGVRQVMDAVDVRAAGPAVAMGSALPVQPAQAMSPVPGTPVMYADPGVVVDQTPRPIGANPALIAGGIVAAPFVAIGQALGGQPSQLPGPGQAVVPARYDHPNLPGYAWPAYSPYPNYASLTYPKQYSPTAWPYIGPFYPYPQVPLGWRKVTLKWDDGWWNLRFYNK